MSLSAIYYDVPDLSDKYYSLFCEGTQSTTDMSYPISGVKGKPYAMLETGGWPLDGCSVLMEDDLPGYYWSKCRSDTKGLLNPPVALTLRLSNPVSATGLTLTFWPARNQWCSRIRIKWYNGNILLQQGEFYPDSAQWVLQHVVEAFDRVHIEFMQTNLPGRYVKLEKVELGQAWHFEAKDLISAELTNLEDPTMEQLKADTMQVKVRVPEGVTLRPQEDQRLVLCREGEPVATHYITGSCHHSRDIYTLEARSCLGRLQENYMGGMYDGAEIVSLLDHVIGNQAYELDPRLQDAKIYGYLPACTQREALRQIALAVGAWVSETADGICRLTPAAQAVEGLFQESDIFLGTTMSNRRRYNKVEVSVHSYTQGEKYRILLDEEPVYGVQLFWFNKPYHDYVVTGGMLMDSDVNYVWIDAQGPVTLQAIEYVHTVEVYSKSDPNVVDLYGENALKLTDATLVTRRNVQAVLQQQLAMAQLWQTMEMEAVISNQKTGQRITAITPWGTQAQGYITRMNNRLTPKGRVAAITMLVAEKANQIVCRYSGEIYSGEEEVLY